VKKIQQQYSFCLCYLFKFEKKQPSNKYQSLSNSMIIRAEIPGYKII